MNDSVVTVGFEHFARCSPEQTAVLETTGKVWTRGELYGLENRLSRTLRHHVEPGQVVAIISPNCAEFLAAYLAGLQIGAYLVAVNWHLNPEDQAYILETAGARAVIVHSRCCDAARLMLEKLAVARPLRISIGKAPGFVDMETFVAGFSADPLEYRLYGRQMSFTSATTGRPKCVSRDIDGARAAHERLLRLSVALNSQLGVSCDGSGSSTALCQSMLYHAAPLGDAILALHLGRRLVLMNKWTPEAALELIQTHAVETTFMVPSMFVRLLKLPEAVRLHYATRSLKHVAHGGAPCPIEVKRAMISWWGPVLREMYGAAEGIGTTADSFEWLRHPGTVGRPYPGTDIRILDEGGRAVVPGTVGMIYIRSYPGERFEYRGDVQKTADAYRGEYFTAGDLGYLDEDGYLFICDRRTDMFTSGGVNVYPAEIEQVLVLHPEVADCAIVGVPDELFGEVPVAVIEPAEGTCASLRLSSNIMRFLAERLSAERLPRRLEYVAALPRDPAGKLFRRRLREMLISGLPERG
jgi:long-chain acyl-CoA synthetase